MISHIIAILSVILILSFACWKKQLTLTATVTGLAVGIVLYIFGGWLSLTALYIFFLSSIMVSNIKKSYKKENIAKVHKKNEKRDYVQVLANSLIAAMLAIIYFITGEDFFLIAVLIAFACYNADTWASELGVLSKKKPVFILGFKETQKGVSGAITLFGVLGSLIGSSLIAMLYFIFNTDSSYLTVLIISLFGFLGAIIDSILGQLFQGLYYDEKNKRYTENKDNNKLVKGYDAITNDVVNFLAPLISVSIFILLFQYTQLPHL